MRLDISDICDATKPQGVGSRITVPDSFWPIFNQALEDFDWDTCKVPGQAFVMLPERAASTVSTGEGKRTSDPKDFVLRNHRGRVCEFLKREHAAPCTGVAVVVYTKAAYLADPDPRITQAERERITASDCTHVLVAVLAFGGPKPPYGSWALIANLAGCNAEAALWDEATIREKATETFEHYSVYCTVAD